MNQYIITEDELLKLMTVEISVSELIDLSRVIRSHPYNPQAEREKVLDEVNAILDIRKSYMEELFEELRDPAVAKHSLQQIEIIRYMVDDLRREGKEEK